MGPKALWYLPLFCRTLRSAQMPRLSFCDDVFSPGDVAARQWVVVEMGGEPLETFKHPDQAIYILGSEDTGLPDSIVQVPLPRSAPTFLPSPCFAFSETLRREAFLCVRALTSRLRTRGAQAATHHVALPSERYESYNVAMAGSIVMYDRIAKLRRGEHL